MKHSNAIQMPSPEFRRRIVVAEIPAGGETCEIVAKPEERVALARRFGLLAIAELSASLRLQPLRHGLVRVEGRLTAALEQACVVTLEPTGRRIDESFAVVYGPASAGAAAREVVVTLDEDGPPEPIEDGAIDLGEATAQRLALALDDYPRAPNASLDSLRVELGRMGQVHNPPSGAFAALVALRQRR